MVARNELRQRQRSRDRAVGRSRRIQVGVVAAGLAGAVGLTGAAAFSTAQARAVNQGGGVGTVAGTGDDQQEQDGGLLGPVFGQPAAPLTGSGGSHATSSGS
jgi:hypothetical protein